MRALHSDYEMFLEEARDLQRLALRSERALAPFDDVREAVTKLSGRMRAFEEEVAAAECASLVDLLDVLADLARREPKDFAERAAWLRRAIDAAVHLEVALDVVGAVFRAQSQ